MPGRWTQMFLSVACGALVALAAQSAQASLIVPDIAPDAEPAMSMNVNPYLKVNWPLEVQQLHELPGDAALPGASTSSSVTTSTSGHAVLVVTALAASPTLVVRLMGELALLFANPPPSGLLRPPRGNC